MSSIPKILKIYMYMCEREFRLYINDQADYYFTIWCQSRIHWGKLDPYWRLLMIKAKANRERLLALYMKKEQKGSKKKTTFASHAWEGQFRNKKCDNNWEYLGNNKPSDKDEPLNHMVRSCLNKWRFSHFQNDIKSLFHVFLFVKFLC